MYEIRKYQVRFLTPAFLGNADQNGQWRTPPFKALLRQWWRVAWAEANNYDPDIGRLRKEEGDLFGSAADGDGKQSAIRIRLNRWDLGHMNSWGKDIKIAHPEVRNSVGSGLYLGYGPLTYDKQSRSTTLKANAAIQADESAMLGLAFPEGHGPLIDNALKLIDSFGALGGRSRNGWGSFALLLESDSDKSIADSAEFPVRDWSACLDRDWPHALGSDDKGALIWRTDAFTDWKTLMSRLAEIKIGLRTQFKFSSGRGSSQPEDRHWLSYPVTHHNVRSWDRNARLPNSLRFKVRMDHAGRRYGVVFHVPCLPPARFKPDKNAIKTVWKKVYQYLDADSNLRRISQ